jgi:hypothetical protein
LFAQVDPGACSINADIVRSGVITVVTIAEIVHYISSRTHGISFHHSTRRFRSARITGHFLVTINRSAWICTRALAIGALIIHRVSFVIVARSSIALNLTISLRTLSVLVVALNWLVTIINRVASNIGTKIGSSANAVSIANVFNCRFVTIIARSAGFLLRISACSMAAFACNVTLRQWLARYSQASIDPDAHARVASIRVGLIVFIIALGLFGLLFVGALPVVVAHTIFVTLTLVFARNIFAWIISAAHTVCALIVRCAVVAIIAICSVVFGRAYKAFAIFAHLILVARVRIRARYVFARTRSGRLCFGGGRSRRGGYRAAAHDATILFLANVVRRLGITVIASSAFRKRCASEAFAIFTCSIFVTVIRCAAIHSIARISPGTRTVSTLIVHSFAVIVVTLSPVVDVGRGFALTSNALTDHLASVVFAAFNLSAPRFFPNPLQPAKDRLDPAPTRSDIHLQFAIIWCSQAAGEYHGFVVHIFYRSIRADSNLKHIVLHVSIVQLLNNFPSFHYQHFFKRVQHQRVRLRTSRSVG